MKASSNKVTVEPVFQPFDLVIRIESLKEAQDIRFLFNYSCITDALKLGDNESRQVRCAIDDQCDCIAVTKGFDTRMKAVKEAVR